MLCVCCCIVCLHCFVSPYVFLGLSCLFVWCVCLSIFVFVCVCSSDCVVYAQCACTCILKFLVNVTHCNYTFSESILGCVLPTACACYNCKLWVQNPWFFRPRNLRSSDMLV